MKINTSVCMECYLFGTSEEIEKHNCLGVKGRLLNKNYKGEIKMARKEKTKTETIAFSTTKEVLAQYEKSNLTHEQIYLAGLNVVLDHGTIAE